MTWWIWALIGLALLAVELITPGGFFAIFFGIAALLVGGLVGLGFVTNPAVEWLLFSVLSVVGVALFRKPIMKALKLDQATKAVDSIPGEEAVVVEDVLPGGIGKAELRGTVWTARTEGAQSLVKGGRYRVDRIEGLTLWLRA
jgi:membrane protein implicated in regulation of membrane protease activity